MIYITRRETFNAAHKLFNPEWSMEENQKIFGKCANTNWHGHNYVLFVTVKGTPDEKTGYVIDLKLLGDIIKEKIIEKIDHKNINLDVDFMKGKMSSTEVLSIAIWDQLEPAINKKNCQLYSVKLHETENNYVEYFGNQDI